MESSKESKGSSTFSATLPFGKAPPMEETYPNVPKYYYIKYEDGLGVDDAPTASLPVREVTHWPRSTTLMLSRSAVRAYWDGFARNVS
jgi:hypothetical protein